MYAPAHLQVVDKHESLHHQRLSQLDHQLQHVGDACSGGEQEGEIILTLVRTAGEGDGVTGAGLLFSLSQMILITINPSHEYCWLRGR